MGTIINLLFGDKIAIIKSAIGIVLLLAIVGGLGWIIHQKNSAIEALAVAELARDKAIENLGTVTEINRTNQLTIAQLRSDAVLQEKLQSSLKIQQERDKLSISTLLKGIASSTAQDDAQIAPVLKNTLDSIQKMRELREKGEQ